MQNATPDIIAMHTTGGDFRSAINTVMNVSNQVSYHFIISRGGEVVQFVDIANTAWANGTNNIAGDNRNNQHSTIPAVRQRRINANLFTISIGFADMTLGNPAPAQIIAAASLIRHIVSEVRRLYGNVIPFERSNIVGHNEITPRTRPDCPGRTFPFGEIINQLISPISSNTVSLDILGDIKPISGYVENGATMVRLTEITDALGFNVEWDSVRRIPVISERIQTYAHT